MIYQIKVEFEGGAVEFFDMEAASENEALHSVLNEINGNEVAGVHRDKPIKAILPLHALHVVEVTITKIWKMRVAVTPANPQRMEDAATDMVASQGEDEWDKVCASATYTFGVNLYPDK